MAKVILGMSVSVNGFINDESGSLGKLYPDFEAPEFRDYINETIPTTGAVMMGRKTFDMAPADSYAIDYEYQVPIFVLTSHSPEKHPAENENLKITFLSDVKEAVEQAKRAAGDKDVVVVGGADLSRQILDAQLADELQIDVIPVLLKSGTRFLDGIAREVQLKKISVKEVGERTCLKFEILKD